MVFLPNILPHIALRPYIRHYMLLHVTLKGIPAELRIKPFPPDADQSLYFYPRDTVQAIVHSSSDKRATAASIFVGQQTSRINLQFGEDHLIIQVCFRGGFMHQLLSKMPMSEFHEREIDAEYLSDNDLRILNERLRETNDYSKMIALIESYLLKRVFVLKVENQAIDKVIALMKDSEKPLSLDWLADNACLSTRQFERKFHERIGMSPKYYSRIIRFNRAYQMKLQQPNLDWLDIAFACNYFDFAHLMRDFREFAEVTPTMLLAQEVASPDWKRMIIK